MMASALIPNQSKVEYGVKPKSLYGIAGHYVKLATIDSTFKNCNNCRTVLLVDGGAGTDVGKYYENGFSEFVLTDPSVDQLRRANGVLKKNKRYTSKRHQAVIVIKQLYFLDDNYLTDVKKVHSTYDAIDWQFALHYSWSVESNDNIVQRLNSLTHLNSKILVSCFDGNKLRQYLKSVKSMKCMITDTDYFELSYIDDVKYKFSNSGNPVDEYYVDIELFTAKLKDSNIVVVTRGDFSESIKDLVANITKEQYNSLNSNYKIIVRSILNMKNTLVYNDMLKYYSFMNYLSLTKQS